MTTRRKGLSRSPPLLMIGASKALPMLLASMALTCTNGSSSSADGGGFLLPDSGYVYDGGLGQPDAEPGDTGPFLCASPCADGTVCGCIDTRPPSCGCHAPERYAQPCDPQVPESCRSPYACVPARKLDGRQHVCSDGREGAPCSHIEETCNTSLGCVCQTSIFGTSCECRGQADSNPLACDPMVPASCPSGTCVRVMSQQSVFFICSDGSQYQPCEPGDGSCRTSLGCTCALSGGRDVCRCTEPGVQPGEPCDPRVPSSCAPPLECQVRFDFERGGYISECAPPGGISDGGSNPFDCDPNSPMCPIGYMCQEVSGGHYRCVIDPL